MWKLIALSGASGSGKTTLAWLLQEKYGQFRQLPNITTRPKRANDEPNLRHMSVEEFEKLAELGSFPWVKEVHGNLYGTYKDDLARVFTEEGTTIFIIAPDCIEQLAEFVRSLGVDLDEVLFLHINAPREDELRRRLEGRGDAPLAIERRIQECKEWDLLVESLELPVVVMSNDGSIKDLEEQINMLHDSIS